MKKIIAIFFLAFSGQALSVEFTSAQIAGIEQRCSALMPETPVAVCAKAVMAMVNERAAKRAQFPILCRAYVYAHYSEVLPQEGLDRLIVQCIKIQEYKLSNE